MASKLKVAVVGASGETGSSIINALLETRERFEVTALARQTSVESKAFQDMVKRGVTVKAVDITEVSDALVQALVGMDVVIDCLTTIMYQGQMNLIEAAHKAKVGRYVPSFFALPSPPRHVMQGRELKEGLLDKIKYHYLPYTVIDIGWWLQLSLPPLPSGRVKSKFEYSIAERIGDGDMPFALTDNRDIGKFVARIIADPQTLNRMVFAYGEVTTQNEIWKKLEAASGEKIDAKHLSNEEIQANIAKGLEILRERPTDMEGMGLVWINQYKLSLGVRGDDIPERAKYLGYLNAKELYPEVECTSVDTYIADMLQGKVREIYSK